MQKTISTSCDFIRLFSSFKTEGLTSAASEDACRIYFFFGQITIHIDQYAGIIPTRPRSPSGLSQDRRLRLYVCARVGSYGLWSQNFIIIFIYTSDFLIRAGCGCLGSALVGGKPPQDPCIAFCDQGNHSIYGRILGD